MKGIVVAILVAWLGISASGIGARQQIDLNTPTIRNRSGGWVRQRWFRAR